MVGGGEQSRNYQPDGQEIWVEKIYLPQVEELVGQGVRQKTTSGIAGG